MAVNLSDPMFMQEFAGLFGNPRNIGGEGGAPNLSPRGGSPFSLLFPPPAALSQNPQVGPIDTRVNQPVPTPVSNLPPIVAPQQPSGQVSIPSNETVVPLPTQAPAAPVPAPAPAPAPVAPTPPLDTNTSIVPEVDPLAPLDIDEALFGSGGVLPQAAALSSVGMLAPDPSRGQATELGELSALLAAIGLEGDFLPQLRDIFNNITSSNLADTPEAQASLELALRPGRERLAFGTNPAIEDAAIAAGQKGSSREGIASGLAQKALIQQEGDISTRFAQDLMQRSFGNQIAGLQLSPQLIANMLVPSQVFGGVGAQQEAFADETAAGPANNLFQLANLVNATRNPEQEVKGLSSRDRNLGIVTALAGLFI